MDSVEQPVVASRTGLDLAIEALLVALLAFGPFSFGAVESWSETIVIALGGMLALLLVIRKFITCQRDRRWWVYLPVIAYLLLAGVQLLPLPGAVVGAISPKALGLRQELLGDLSNAPAILRRMTLSLYPRATRHDLRIVLLATIVFVTVLNVFRTQKRIRRLALWIALIGAAVGGLALAQDLARAPAIYWRVNIGHTAYSGPFVNHNHYAQFMNLCIGGALAIFLSSLRKNTARLRNIAWWTIPIILAGAITIPLSLSRGGFLAMLAGSFAVALLLAIGRQGRRRAYLVLLVIATIAIAALVHIGIDRIYNNLLLATQPIGYGSRVQMDRDAILVFRDFPGVGSGLGTHEWVFPAYEHQTIPNIATHVENEYVQTLEEMGAAGLLFVLALAAIVLVGAARAVRRGDPVSASLAIGLAFGLVAVLFHSLTDYGQHLPAIACLSAVTCGLLVNLGWPEITAAHERWTMPTLFGMCALLLAGWGVGSELTAYRADVIYQRARTLGDHLADRYWRASDRQFSDLVAGAQRAVNLQPGNVLYRYWLGAYQWRSLTRNRTPAGKVTLSNAEVNAARRVVTDLNRARALCPVYGPLYWYIGERERALGDTAAGDRHILEAARLAPNDADAVYAAANVNAEHERWDVAGMEFRRALVLDQSLLDRIIDLYIHTYAQPQRVIDLFADNWRLLLRVSDHFNGDPAQQAFFDQSRGRVVSMLEAIVSRPDASPRAVEALATIYFGRGDTEKSEKLFKRVLAVEPANVPARFLRARALQMLHRIPEARQEAEIVKQQIPNYPGLSDLLKLLSK